MRSWMRAHTCGKDSGVSPTRGVAGLVLLVGGATVAEAVMAWDSCDLKGAMREVGKGWGSERRGVRLCRVLPQVA